MNLNAMSPCQAACPIQMDIPGYVAALSRGDLREADRIIRLTNPFPSVCGRICTRECETACRRGQNVDEPVAIRDLKRFAADKALHMPSGPLEPYYSERVAVIGSGPAGLTAAHDLALLGYKVTVLEAADELGGMMTRGIPGYRLPVEIVRKEIERILALGVEARTDQVLGRDYSLHYLRSEYQAVFLAIGSEKSFCPDCRGVDLSGVLTAVEFLKDVSRGERPYPGKRVAVIGGGHTAIDVARTCLRLGSSEVSVVYRRTIDEMPAGTDEVETAQEEGVVFRFVTSPVEFLGSENVEKMRCVRMMVDKSRGRKGALVCVQDSEFDIEVDAIILATGYGPRTETVPELFDSEDGKVEIKDGTGATNMAGVFVGGDFLSGPTSVVKSIASGRRGAASIHRYLRGLAPADISERTVLDELNDKVAEQVPKAARRNMTSIPVDERLKNFDEVELGFSLKEAMAEAGRCLNCSLGANVSQDCVSCLNCVLVCPYQVPRPGDEQVDIDPAQCQACGICAGQCPASAIDLDLESRQSFHSRIKEVLKKAEAEAPYEFTLQFICDFTDSNVPAAEPEKSVFQIFSPGLGRVGVYELLAPFEAGAREVQVYACGDGECKFKNCDYWTGYNVQRAAKVLEGVGLDPGRLMMIQK